MLRNAARLRSPVIVTIGMKTRHLIVGKQVNISVCSCQYGW
jgi:hypothetical protein